jgi:RimJ/RimL family protein N-acetyltransferase
MGTDAGVLIGRHVRLEPLDHRHVDGLVRASANDPALYRWTVVPTDHAEATRYVEAALTERDDGNAVPYATVRVADDELIGSTRFWNLERWPWPEDHPLHKRGSPDAAEIGYTWLTRSAIRTAANSEANLLMLTHAFEDWQALRICFHTDARNARSRAAIERLGANRKGSSGRIASPPTRRCATRRAIRSWRRNGRP